MAEKKTAKLGEMVEVKNKAVVTRPNGDELTITGGSYVLDEAGVHVVDGEEITVK
jgi:hypothetical protein